MAKTIKFNLFLDGNPVRDIEGLQENFNINDILEIHKKGILQKWLKVRGFSEYLEKVNRIKDTDSVIVQLIKIFDINKSEKEIMEAIYFLSFWEERKIELEEWEKKNNKIRTIVNNYHNGYDVLKNQIDENKTDMPFLKSVAKEIKNNYYNLFRLDFWDFFSTFKDTTPMVVYAILLNSSLRKIFLDDDDVMKILKTQFILSTKPRQDEFINVFLTLPINTTENEDTEIVNDLSKDDLPLLMFSGETDDYWKDIVSKSKKIMVLSIPAGTYIRNAGISGEELSSEDVEGAFLILNGLDYKSNNSRSNLVYMEV